MALQILALFHLWEQWQRGVVFVKLSYRFNSNFVSPVEIPAEITTLTHCKVGEILLNFYFYGTSSHS